MTEKAQIVAELGETAVLLPNLLASGLRANDRVKYYMSLMQACREHVARPDEAPPDLRSERQASGEDDATLDEVISGSRARFDNAIVVPQASHIHEQLLKSIEQMFAPLHAAGTELVSQLDAYEQRFGVLRNHLPPVTDDTIPAGYIETVTRAERKGADSLHLLVMDLHRELNRLQSSLAERSLDGAKVYSVSETDESLVRAFMRGVNATAPLKFDHPGLGTTATHIGDRLVIQNDIGTTDAHVLVLHVTGLTLSFIYTDVHRARLQFFKGCFDQAGLTWSERRSGAEAQVRNVRRPADLRESRRARGAPDARGLEAGVPHRLEQGAQATVEICEEG